jgi:hypothetical protein
MLKYILSHYTLSLKQAGWKGMGWVHLVQGRHPEQILVNKEQCLSKPSKVGYFSTEGLLPLKKDSAQYGELGN